MCHDLCPLRCEARHYKQQPCVFGLLENKIRKFLAKCTARSIYIRGFRSEDDIAFSLPFRGLSRRIISKLLFALLLADVSHPVFRLCPCMGSKDL